MQKQMIKFLTTRFSVLRHVRDAMANSQDKQKEQADAIKAEDVLILVKLETKSY